MIKFLSYNKYSESCRLLKEALKERGVKRVLTTENIKFVRPEDICVIWGSHRLANEARRFGGGRMCANRNLDTLTTNKREFFSTFRGVCGSRLNAYLPRFVTSKAEVPNLFAGIKSKEKEIVCRTKLSSHSGEGIVMINDSTKPDDIPDCGLYVEYIKKKDEYRVHMFLDHKTGNYDYFVQHKLRKTERLDEGTVDYKVRNLNNGWVYVNVPKETIPQETLNHLGQILGAYSMEFGAIDVIYNQRRDAYYVLEINSAPGVNNETLDFYADSIYKLYSTYAVAESTTLP